MLYRGDSLHHVVDDELDVFASLGLRTVIDLRSSRELDEFGRFRHGTPNLVHQHVPLIDAAGPSSVPQTVRPRTLAEAYIAMATAAQPAVARIVDQLAGPGGLPALFHCTAGKDRTGIVAAIVLSAIGVIDEDVVTDYALTANSRAARQAWLRQNDPQYLAYLESLPPEALEVRADAVQSMLDQLRTDHGSVTDYLVNGGLPAEAVNRLAASLLEASPGN